MIVKHNSYSNLHIVRELLSKTQISSVSHGEDKSICALHKLHRTNVTKTCSQHWNSHGTYFRHHKCIILWSRQTVWSKWWALESGWHNRLLKARWLWTRGGTVGSSHWRGWETKTRESSLLLGISPVIWLFIILSSSRQGIIGQLWRWWRVWRRRMTRRIGWT